ncbi:hypothetical protein RKE38_06570 [Phycicoccus sp. M110.8]|uniref:hypothetical protein n=1 Tax=Phycicoccus sp. M110.8 TaxID=3075433 RepID=UPI0028FD840C|nr:hypothetical protein [Phycicoccus sp. M110.8]MDU0313347.1 hypothetical protein [Phycicoccus sp. M110.8]
MSEVPEQESAPVLPLTRRERRAVAEASRSDLPTRALAVRPVSIVATIAFAALVALTGYASPRFVALAVALGGFVLAWGWPVLLGLPSPRGTTTVLSVGVALTTAAVLLTRDEPYLEWMPAAMALAVLAAFAHQLLRRDGRPRLTESIASTVAGLAIVASGAAFAPIPQYLYGEHGLAAAMAGLAVGVLADPLISVPRLRQWALFISMFAGGLAALVVALVAGEPTAGSGALLGLLAAAISHAARRVLAPLPAAPLPRAQLASALAASLLVGVIAFTVVTSPVFSG